MKTHFLHATAFALVCIVSCVPTFADGGCRAPQDADLSSCLYLSDNALNEAYAELMSPIYALLDEHEKTALRNEEREWVAHRNSECHLGGKDALNSTGINDPSKARCVVASTTARVARLQERIKVKESEIAAAQTSGTPYAPPAIPETGKSIADFVPRGYLIFEQARADFNGDKLADIAVVLSPTASRQFDPRPLLILLARAGGGYVLSARNDDIALTYGVGGIANPNGTDILKASGRSLYVQDLTGGSESYAGIIQEFRLLDGAWRLVGEEEFGMSRRGDADVVYCDGETAIEVPEGWKCTEHRTHTDFLRGRVVESWTLRSKKDDQERIKTLKREAVRGDLKRFQDVGVDKRRS